MITNSDFPFFPFEGVLRKGRKDLIEDILNENPDLYGGLYCDLNSEMYRIQICLYETNWLEQHWKAITDILDTSGLSMAQKSKAVEKLVEWYKILLSSWDYDNYDYMFLREKILILQEFVFQNNAWEYNKKKLSVSFAKSKKTLKKQLEQLKEMKIQ